MRKHPLFSTLAVSLSAATALVLGVRVGSASANPTAGPRPEPAPAVASVQAPVAATLVVDLGGLSHSWLRSAQLHAPSHIAAPPPAPVPAPGVWHSLRDCESGGNYAENTGNGYYGAYQFSAATWWGLGFKGLPSQAPYWVQDAAARDLQTRSGWGQWPGCAYHLGLL